MARATCGARFKVHGEARAGGDPAGMDAGSRPLTMDGNWPGRSSKARASRRTLRAEPGAPPTAIAAPFSY